MTELTLLRSTELPTVVARRLRSLMDAAFDGGFDDDAWEHALGGWHAVATDDGEPVAHAAVVPRTIDVGPRAYDAGYVEAVATAPDRQGEGVGSRVMAALDELIPDHFEFGVLSTGAHHFYERLGWERWRGPTYVIRDGDHVRTADEDYGIMVLRFGASAEVALTDPITCRARTGADW